MPVNDRESAGSTVAFGAVRSPDSVYRGYPWRAEVDRRGFDRMGPGTPGIPVPAVSFLLVECGRGSSYLIPNHRLPCPVICCVIRRVCGMVLSFSFSGFVTLFGTMGSGYASFFLLIQVCGAKRFSRRILQCGLHVAGNPAQKRRSCATNIDTMYINRG